MYLDHSIRHVHLSTVYEQLNHSKPFLPLQKKRESTKMSHEVQSALGTTCPDSPGSFYVCEDKPTRFVGCCTVDPCKTTDGVCPDDNLTYTSFDQYSYNQIKPQECVSERPDVQWFTCGAIAVPFMGCCSVNPCVEEDGCPAENLFAARLSDDAEEAAGFLPEDHGEGGGLSTGATAGIAVGAAVVGLLIIGGLVWWFMKRRKRQQKASSTYEPYAGQQHQPHGTTPMGSPLGKQFPASTTSPYSSTYMGSPTFQNTQQQQQHPHHHPQQSYDGSQSNGGFVPSPFHNGQSPPLSQGAFSPSPYTSGHSLANYQQVMGLAPLNNQYMGHHQQEQSHVVPAQELPGHEGDISMLHASELGAVPVEDRENGISGFTKTSLDEKDKEWTASSDSPVARR